MRILMVYVVDTCTGILLVAAMTVLDIVESLSVSGSLRVLSCRHLSLSSAKTQAQMDLGASGSFTGDSPRSI